MQAGSVISLSPSFNSSYSNTRLAGIAERVAEEFASDGFHDEFYMEREGNWGFVEREEAGNTVIPEEDEVEDGEFEFAFARRDSELPSPVSADEIFCNGQIRPVYPVFNPDLLPKRNEFESGSEKEDDVVSTVRLPLMKLFIEERETPLAAAAMSSCSSSSEEDELDGIPADTYCVWRPKETAAEEEGRCEKSSSTGSSSQRWNKFRDLLRRSHSDGGKDLFVFLSRGSSGRKTAEDKEKDKTAGRVKPAAHLPLNNRIVGEKRRSYLPYRQDLVGLFAGINGYGFPKNLQPF